MSKYIAIFLFSVFVSSCSQVILKKSAKKEYKHVIFEYLNPRVIFSYGLFFVSTLLTMYAYKGVPLTFGSLLESVGYIYILILSALFLKEKITLTKVMGNLFIIAGIFCYALL